MGYSLRDYQRMTWKEFYYACEYYNHKKDLGWDRTRTAIAWIVSHSMGVKKPVQPKHVRECRTIERPKKVYPRPGPEEQAKAIEEGVLVYAAIQEHYRSKKR